MKDRLRRAAAPIPDGVAFATKPMLGLAMLERARAAGVPFARITGDSVYGGVYALRPWARQHRCGSVLTVTASQHLGLRPDSDWMAGLGDADRPCLYDWAFLRHAGGAEGFRCGLLVRRSPARRGTPQASDDLADHDVLLLTRRHGLAEASRFGPGRAITALPAAASRSDEARREVSAECVRARSVWRPPRFDALAG